MSMEQVQIEWVTEVPDSRKRQGKWARICEQLRSRPGEWAKVYTSSNTAFATMLKQGKLGNAEPGEFSATCRRRTDGDYDIYAMFVDTSAEEAPAPPARVRKPRAVKKATAKAKG